MAGWSILGNGSTLDYLEMLMNLQNSGFSLDLDVDSLKMSNDVGKDDKRRELFDQVLSLFLKEFSLNGSSPPLPATLGDGKCVDLFKLFWIVKGKGGYDVVSHNRLWGLVAEEIGLDSGVAATVKLFHFKYLNILDRWHQSSLRHKGKGSSVGVAECDRNSGLLPPGLKMQLNDFFRNILDKSRINEEQGQLVSRQIYNHVSSAEDVYNRKKVHNLAEPVNFEKRNASDDDEDVVILDKSEVNQEVFSRKRKRETLSGMLNWLTEIAKNPRDGAIGKITEAFKKNEYGDHECRKLVLLARIAFLENRNIYWMEEKESPLWQKKQKMHPSMYEDQLALDNLCNERFRYSARVLSQTSELDLYHVSSDLDTSATSSVEIGSDGTPDQVRKEVPLGPLFQAEIPEWTDTAPETDPKWLGTVHWPMKTKKHVSLSERAFIGKGREETCDCQHPGSVECVRFHIAEKRMRLKSELGLAFYTWRFHFMGEEVSLSWTEEEEDKFKSTVRLNPPSMDKCFWNQLRRCFRSKGWKNLVSYYFNVFVLRRRTYQNRVTPNDIDSDDDESEFGSFSNGFGQAAVEVPSFRSIACGKNSQCTDSD